MSFEHTTDAGQMGPTIGEPVLPSENADKRAADTEGTELWEAPYMPGLLDATVHIPGSKSLTNRAIVLAALGTTPSTIKGALISRDTKLMMKAVEELGAQVSVEGTTITVTPPDVFEPKTGFIDCGLAGTVMRFIPPLAAFATKPVRFDGDKQARMRPMRPLLDALEELGVKVTYEKDEGFLPFVIEGPGPDKLKGGMVKINARLSSQFISAMILVGHRFTEGLHIRLAGQMPSPAHVHMTVAEVEKRGGEMSLESLPALIPGEMPTVHGWIIKPGKLTGGDFDIEPDLTNAGPFLAATLICGGQVRIENWPAHTTQIGDLWRKIVPGMGGRIGRDSTDTLVARGTGTIGGLDLNLSDGGELAPMVAALAAVAVNPSKITGIGHLTGHETNRLKAIVNEIEAIGSSATATRHSLTITPGITHGAEIETYNDHRMVMFGALVGLAVPGIKVRNPQTVNKTFPDFIAEWEAMCATGTDKPKSENTLPPIPY